MKLSRLLAAFGLMMAFGVGFAPKAHADVNDFTITHFSADETLSRNDAQGSLHIVEIIDVVFTDNNHGIIRAIPNDYNGQPLHFHLNNVSSRSSAPAQVSQSFENGNVVLRIGDPNRMVTGAQSYIIDYSVENVIGFFSDHDELYWDVNGDQWKQPVSKVDVTLHLPSGLTFSSDQTQCFAGNYGQEMQKCTVSATANTVTASASNLTANQTLTYVVGFAKGYFHPETTTEKVQDNLNPLLSLLVLPLAAVAAGFTWWWRKGRDEKGRGVIVPEYDPPQDMLPIEAGTLLDFKTDNRDITATLIDLARRGYLRIHEEVTKRRLRKDKLSYSLELTKTDFSELSAYETKLISALFTDTTAGAIVELGKVNTSFVTAVATVRRSVEKNLIAKGYTKKPSYIQLLYILGGIVLAVGLLAILFSKTSPNAVGISIGGGIVSVVLVCLFAAFIAARTTEGTAAREQLLGLKMYMELTEKDRIAMLQSPNAPYAENKDEPKRTVELFEKLLPYAIIFGIEEQWAKQFESLYTTPPSWYSGNGSNFNSLYLASSLHNNLGQAISTSFTPPSSSSSSGFGGGGFSGGGGGGGGGGGW